MQQGRPVRHNVLVIQSPALLQVDETLPGAIAAGEGPGILRIDAIRRGVEITLVTGAGIVRRIDDGIGAGLVDVRRLHAIPAQERLHKTDQIRLGWRIHIVEDAEVGGLVGRICLHGTLDQLLQVLTFEVCENRAEL